MEKEILEITKKELEEVKKIANEAIQTLYKNGRADKKKLEQLGIDGAINWGNLKCYDTEVAINVYVDEASPVAVRFQEYIREHIEKRLRLSLPIEVITEW